LAVFGLLIVGLLAYGLKASLQPKRQSPTSQGSGKIKVVASFYPLAEFTSQVAKEHAEVTNMTPAGAEPHDYEPTPQQIAGIYNAKLLVANGAGLDPWANKIKSDLQAHGIAVISLSDQFQLLPPPDQESTADPHFWLDPALSQQEVGAIRDALIKVDPVNAGDYQKNAAGYIGQLKALDQQYQQGLASCTKHDVVTSHAAFGYLAKHYGLNQIAIAGLSPDAEPSAARMAEIAQEAKQKDIKVIFFETLVSPKLAQTIATEIGAQTAVFNPLEGLTDEELQQGKNYISVMQDNLNNLRSALECK